MQTYKKLTNKQLYRHSNTSFTVTMQSEIAVLFVIVPLLTNLPNMTDLALRNKYFANIFLAYRLGTQLHKAILRALLFIPFANNCANRDVLHA